MLQSADRGSFIETLCKVKTAIKVPYGGGNGTRERNKQNILRSRPRDNKKGRKEDEAKRRGRMLEEEENTLKYLRLPLQPQSFLQFAIWVEEQHGLQKQDPGRARSLATAGTKFTKSRAHNSVLLCDELVQIVLLAIPFHNLSELTKQRPI